VKKPESKKIQKNTKNKSIFQNPGIKVKTNLRVKKSGVFDFSAVPDLPVLASSQVLKLWLASGGRRDCTPKPLGKTSRGRKEISSHISPSSGERMSQTGTWELQATIPPQAQITARNHASSTPGLMPVV
jgi:hypothetical protein